MSHLDHSILKLPKIKVFRDLFKDNPVPSELYRRKSNLRVSMGPQTFSWEWLTKSTINFQRIRILLQQLCSWIVSKKIQQA